MEQHGITPPTQGEERPLSPGNLDITPETDSSSKPDFNFTFSTKEVSDLLPSFGIIFLEISIVALDEPEMDNAIESRL